MGLVEGAKDFVVYENDDKVECPVNSNFVDEWETYSYNSNPKTNHRERRGND